MANGVGIVAVLAGSVPRIAGPRPADPPRDAERPTSALAQVRPAGRSAPRPEPSAAARVRIESGGPSVRPPRAPGIAGTARSERASDPSPVSAKEVVRRTAEALRAVPLRDGSRLRLSLRPAHLGDLCIELSVAGSRVRARIRTETEAARDLILAHLEDLRRDLDRRGLRIGRFDVDVDGPPRPEAEAPAGGPRSHRRQVLDLDA